VTALVTFSGCSGTVSQFSPRVTSSGGESNAWQVTQPFAALQTESASPTLYASSSTANTVTEYQLPSDTIIGTLGASSGINNGPSGMFFSKDKLYVTNGNQVLIFPVGKTTPSLILQDPISAPFADDVVAASDGTVYVANEENDYCGYGEVVVFKKGQTAPEYTIIPPKVNFVLSVTLDSSNNLYIAYDTTFNTAHIREYAPGSQTGTETGWSVKSPSGMVFDKSGNLVVVDGTIIDVFTPGIPKPVRTFGSLNNGGFVTLNRSETLLFSTNWGANEIDELNYSTGKMVKTITLAGAAGIAIDPSSSP